jgi:hypothetical protein
VTIIIQQNIFWLKVSVDYTLWPAKCGGFYEGFYEGFLSRASEK